MRVFKSFIIIALLMSAANLWAETEIHFKDGSPEWRKQVGQAFGEFRESDSTSLADSLHIILIEEGFFDNSIEFISIDSVPQLNVEFGPQFMIGQLYFEGDKIDTIDYFAIFSRHKFESFIDSILDIYQARGYYFSTLSPLVYQEDGHEIDVRIHLQTGPIVTISDVHFSGANNTSRDLLTRYVTVNVGDTLDLSKIQDSSDRIDRLKFISTVGNPDIFPDTGYRTVRVNYNLVEGRQFIIEGAGGFIPDDNGYFIGYLKSQMQNFFGGGRSIGLLIDHREKNKSVLDLAYGQPLFLIGLGRGEARVMTRDYREQFYEFGLRGQYSFDINDNLSARLGLGWKDTELKDVSSSGYEVYDVSVGAELGSLQRAIRGSSRLGVSWDIQYAARRYNKSSEDSVVARQDINDMRNKLRVETELCLLSPITLYNRFNFHDIKSTEKPLPISELFQFGGPSSIRGYRNDQFAARRLFISGSEVRLFIAQDNYFYPFFDAAYYEYYGNATDGFLRKYDDFIMGYGFGFNLDSGYRRVGIELSWGEDSLIDEPRLNVIVGGRF